MKTASISISETTIAMASPRTARLKRWAVLALSIMVILLFLFVLGPMGLRTTTLKPMADFIEENNINANAYYYTEVDEFFEAERHMREHILGVPGSARNSAVQAKQR